MATAFTGVRKNDVVATNGLINEIYVSIWYSAIGPVSHGLMCGAVGAVAIWCNRWRMPNVSKGKAMPSGIRTDPIRGPAVGREESAPVAVRERMIPWMPWMPCWMISNPYWKPAPKNMSAVLCKKAASDAPAARQRQSFDGPA